MTKDVLKKRTRERSQSPAWGERLPGAKRGERNISGGDHQSNIKSEPIKKEKADFEKSGKLTEDSNAFRGVVIKYNEPPEARKMRHWRRCIFKGTTTLPKRAIS